ncbi:two-component system, NarL family, sensor histidine kinase EvgS [Vibrio crassostreae]|nr:two-component system, NarL family, sensor histidine kinase EvgS [Vibrio crassostreae]CAK2909014.1 two-component system, NarL family, sensor histidine kinase EvgS [Vibrio crassostreae]CAK2913238.1 two-component system, NarL family, sensor histidine kinase EvgS [Vibrio crassostreae]CAK2913539.1 two-component system, NarL family, sensor histidine kinase EvgS [Vibrio crassostreae]CAK2914021.1 two-component system, NarL family, sensor histidine kinase EvgS [Vibrio crassostreae]
MKNLNNFFIFLFLSLLSLQVKAIESLRLTEQEKQYLKSKSHLVVASFDMYYPPYSQFEGGVIKGIHQDITNQISDILNIPIETKIFPHISGVIDDISSGNSDISIGYSDSRYRSQNVIFSKIIYKEVMAYWIDVPENIEEKPGDMTWTCVQGSSYCDYLQERYDTIVPALDFLASIELVREGIVDGIASNYASLINYSFNTYETGQIKLFDDNYIEENRIIISNKEPVLESVINKAITYINNSGGINSNNKYFHATQANIRQISEQSGSNTLRYTITRDMFPALFIDKETKKPSGYVIDILRQISLRTSLNFQYVESHGEEALDLFKENKIDLIAYANLDDPKLFDDSIIQSQPYTNAQFLVLMGQNDSPHVGVLSRAEAFNTYIDSKFGDEFSLTFYTQPNEIFKALIDGDIGRAFLNKDVIGYDFLARYSGKIALAETENFYSVPVGMVLRGQHITAMDLINRMLYPMTNLHIEQFKNRYNLGVINYGYNKRTLMIISGTSLLIILGLFLFHILRRNRLQKILQAQYSEKKKASEEALWFATLLDDLPVLVSVVDDRYNQVFTNKAYRKYFQNCVKCSNDNYLCALTDPQLHNDEFDETYCATNESYFKRYVHHVENPRTGKKFQILVLDDTTKAHKHKKELVNANQVATKAIDTRSRFLAVITHELRTPINGIVGLLELLERKNNDKEQNMFIDSIRKSAYVLNNHVSDILDFSKMEAGESHLVIAHTNILIGIDTILKAQQSHALGKNIDFKVYWQPTPVTFVATDIDKVQQVISNLLSNAIKFTESGTVTITLSVTQNSLQFQVQDTGIGMTEEQIQSIFEPFVQADNSTSRRFGGTGLGMTIVDTIIKQFKGSIDITSEVNFGTSITVSIPLHDVVSKPDVPLTQFDSTSSIINSWLAEWGRYNEGSQPFNAPLLDEIYEKFPSEIYTYLLSFAQPTLDVEPNLVQFSAHILVAEDNKINQLMIKQQLEEIGIDCSIASDGQEAIALFEQDPTKYDLMITDNHMPFMDGFELTQQVRNSQKNADISIIGCTADDPKTTHAECLNVGMSDVLYKPYELKDLIDVLRRHLPLNQEEQKPKAINESDSEHFEWINHIKKSNQKELLQVISESFSSDIEDLSNNPNHYKKIAHKVKGAAQLLKIQHIVELTEEMENFEYHNPVYNERLCNELIKIIKIADEAIP